MAHGKRNPKPGDLIEIDRSLHQHWALYVGDGYVINLTPVGNQAINRGVQKVPVFTRKVKKQLLKEVVENNKWRVNNKSDKNHTPLPVEEIIRCAEGYVGERVTYPVFGSNCEHFVKKLRYGDQLRAFVLGEVHTPDMTHDKYYPKPGDLIEIKRRGYQHWAVYVGDGYVIHMTSMKMLPPPLVSSSGTILTRKAKVKKELLKEVAGNDDWDVNNKYDRYRTPFPMEEIIRRAERWIDQEVPYRLFLGNCEHFVTMVRYGEAVSDQARRALWHFHYIFTGMAVAGTAVLTVASTPPVVAAVGVNLLASFGFGSSNIVHIINFVKFTKAQRDILEQMCC